MLSSQLDDVCVSLCEGATGTGGQKPGLPLTLYNTRAGLHAVTRPKASAALRWRNPPLEARPQHASARKRRRESTPALDRHLPAHPIQRILPPRKMQGSLLLPSLGSETPEKVCSNYLISEEMECRVRKPESTVTYSPKHLDLFGLLN